MILYKLNGYTPSTDTYINPVSGQKENLPSPPFVIDESAPENYSLFDAPEDWANYAGGLMGEVVGLKDYCSLRYEIYIRIQAICGNDYANWENLSAEQKQVALVWCNIAIVNTRGIIFYITQCGGQSIADSYIANYLNQSFDARDHRYYVAFTIYGFTYMGKAQGLKAESYARADQLDTTYIDRGVMFKSEDGIDGLGDWILGTNGYTTTGLKPRINAGEFTLLLGMDADTFCNTLVAILNDGEY